MNEENKFLKIQFIIQKKVIEKVENQPPTYKILMKSPEGHRLTIKTDDKDLFDSIMSPVLVEIKNLQKTLA